MTISIKKNPAVGWEAVVVWANWFHFESAQKVNQPCVESRLFLWCTSGAGRVCVNGKWLDLVMDDWLFLPWGREMVYEAAARSPFCVGAIHLIPAHHPQSPVTFAVAHDSNHPLANSKTRKDAFWEGLDGITHGSMAQTETLRLLATYIVERFHLDAPEPWLMKQAAVLLKKELLTAGHRSLPILPVTLRRLMDYAEKQLQKNLSVSDLAGWQGCGEATVYRLFKNFLKTTPAHWMAEKRALEAARFLRTTHLSIQQIGERIGIPDPFQFSRFFKRHHNMSPRAFQKQRKNF
jgi:AraC-like DNA-binding protein